MPGSGAGGFTNVSDVAHGARLDRVETEVSTIRSEMSGLKADVRGLGTILSRIEDGVLRAQERAENREAAGRPSLVAVVSILITIIATLVGGAWLVGGQLARLDERSVQREKDVDRLWGEIRGGQQNVVGKAP